MGKKNFFSTNQKKILQLQKWNKTYLAVLLGYETIIWHHQSQNLGFFQVLIRAHCVTTEYCLEKNVHIHFYFSKQNIAASQSMLDKRILSITGFPVGVYRIRRIEKSDGLRTSLQSLKGELSSFLSIPAPFVDSKAI